MELIHAKIKNKLGFGGGPTLVMFSLKINLSGV